MKILHCCLAAFYIDNYSYQENVLPKIHKLQGHDVEIIASTETYVNNLKLGYVKASTYYTENKIKITRLPYVNWVPKFIVKKLRIYSGLYNEIERFNPDIIFLHDCQFLSIRSVIKFAKKNKPKIFIDSHTDFVNSGKNWISKNILHKIIYKYCAKSIEELTTKFYGTLPVRSEFLNKVYGITKNKIELLPFGADDTLFKFSEKAVYRNKIRKLLSIPEEDFVIITGGKIDERKNIHLLIRAFNDAVEENSKINFHLIVFGKPVEALREEIEKLCLHRFVHYIEWLESKFLFKYFFASDLAIFPGTHSVLWEEAVGLGIPCVFNSWEGIKHLDVGGNCLFIKRNDYLSLRKLIAELFSNSQMIWEMSEAAKILGPKYFSYSNIAKQSLEIKI